LLRQKGAKKIRLANICRQSFGNICRQSFGNKLYCIENFKAEFFSVKTRYDYAPCLTIKKFCQRLSHSPFNSRQKNCRISSGTAPLVRQKLFIVHCWTLFIVHCQQSNLLRQKGAYINTLG